MNALSLSSPRFDLLLRLGALALLALAPGCAQQATVGGADAGLDGGRAGTDAGAATPDGGLPDAGAAGDGGRSADAGRVLDAGLGADGGVLDGGRFPDAGFDGGTRDSGPPDAGPADAGPADAGTAVPDAGPPDAGGPSVTPFACPAGSTEAVFVGEVPPPATLAPYARFAASVTFANCGGQTWNATSVGAPDGYKLGFDGPRDYDTWGANRLPLPADVPPGFQVVIPVSGRATPLTGPHDYRWSILHEGVAWLAGPSPTDVIDVQATPSVATICPGVQADIGGGASASAQVQQCIDAVPSGGTLELPLGVYRITSELQFTRPILLRTAGTAGSTANCLDPAGPACGIFRADDNLNVPRGFIHFGATSGVTLEHVVIDGNRGLRLSSAAAAQCAAGNNGPGFNASTGGCVSCAFRYGVSARALCGTGWEWNGDQATITGCAFRENGAHAVQNMWSDGLTAITSNGGTLTGNQFLDNSDVDLIFGGGTQATVSGNEVLHLAQASFAGLMLDNFNGGTSGDFTGSQISGNTIQCGAQLCDFAIELGPHPWYLSANIIGGTVTNNVAMGGKFNLNAEGAGTPAAPITVTGNTLGPSPANATFQCGSRASTAFNISPDSTVLTGAGPAATGAIQFHGCP